MRDLMYGTKGWAECRVEMVHSPLLQGQENWLEIAALNIGGRRLLLKESKLYLL